MTNSAANTTSLNAKAANVAERGRTATQARPEAIRTAANTKGDTRGAFVPAGAESHSPPSAIKEKETIKENGHRARRDARGRPQDSPMRRDCNQPQRDGVKARDSQIDSQESIFYNSFA